MINDKAGKAIEKRFKSLKNRYQDNLESIKSSEFVFDFVYLLYYKCHNINLNCSGSHIDPPDWTKTINHINKKNKCFQYAVTFALNHEEIKKHLQRITKIKLFINKYNCE